VPAASHRSIGVILPDDGPFDYEWLRLRPWLRANGFAQFDYHLTRTPADGIMVPDNLRAIGRKEVLVPAARRLVAKGAEIILWACTTGSFVGGRQDAEAQADEIVKALGTPATNTSLAMVEAALSLGTREVDLLSAYTDEVTSLLARFLRDSGLSVERVSSLGCVHTADSAAVDIEAAVARFAEQHPGSSRPIMIPDTAINTLSILPRLMARAGRPVITANQASLWHALACLDPDTTPDVLRLYRL
jgi:maleate cis-trans isomerase